MRSELGENSCDLTLNHKRITDPHMVTICIVEIWGTFASVTALGCHPVPPNEDESTPSLLGRPSWVEMAMQNGVDQLSRCTPL